MCDALSKNKMRGSPFQQRSALESIRQNEQYLKHRQRVTEIQLSPRLARDTSPLKEFTEQLRKLSKNHEASESGDAL